MAKVQKNKSIPIKAKPVVPPKKPRRRIDWMTATIVVLCFVLYGNTIPNRYSMDDEFVAYNNKRIEGGIKEIPGIWASSYAEGKMTYEYRPVVKTTFAIEYQIFNGNPHVSHFFNILLYAVICLLLFHLLKKIFRDTNPLFLFVTVIVFLAHPIHTEVVSSLKNRDELLSFLGCLITLHFLIKYVDTSKIKFVVFSFISFLLSYWSKESALVFLAIYPLILYYYSGPQIKKLMIVIVTIFVVVIIARYIPKLYLPKPEREVFLFENPLFFKRGLFLKLGTGMITLLFYLKLFLYPHPLLFYYGYDQIPVVGLGNAVAIISLLIHLGLFAFAIWKIKEKHILSFAILYYLICLSMFANIVKPAMGIVAERYAFSATLGFSMFVAFMIFLLFKKKTNAPLISVSDRTKILAVLVVLLIPYSAKTITRNTDWKSQISLYRNDIKYLDKSAKANALFAGQLLSIMNKSLFNGQVPPDLKEKVDSIIKYYKRSVEIYPDYYSSINNIGSVYFTVMKDYNKAIPYFLQSIKINPKYTEAYFNLAYSTQMQGNITDAIWYYRKSIALKPDYSRALSNLANLYYDSKGETDSAMAINKRIMKIDSTSDLPYVNIANYYLKSKDTVNAVAYMEKAVKKFPLNYKLCQNLAKYFANKDVAKSERYSDMAVKARKKVMDAK